MASCTIGTRTQLGFSSWSTCLHLVHEAGSPFPLPYDARIPARNYSCPSHFSALFGCSEAAMDLVWDVFLILAPILSQTSSCFKRFLQSFSVLHSCIYTSFKFYPVTVPNKHSNWVIVNLKQVAAVE